MIAVLIDAGEAPAAALHLLAEQMERSLDNLHVQVIELHLGRDQRSGLSGGLLPRSGEVVRVAGLVQEVGPALIGLQCTHLNAPAVLALCDRLHQIAPEREIVLWGREAVARQDEILAIKQVDKILLEPTSAAVVALLRRAQPPRIAEPTLDHSDPRLQQLISNSRRLGAAVVVGPLETSASLGVDQAVRQILPLLRAGTIVRLQDPDLCGCRSNLCRLLKQLPAAAGRLILPLPGQVVDEEVVSLLLEVGIYRLELDLSRLAEEDRLDPGQLRALLLPLFERPVSLSGELVFGLPTMDRTVFGQAVDRCLETGLEDLQLERLLVPPHSPLRARAADYDLVHAAAPPYEVLRHGLARAEEIIALARFAATYRLVSPPLEGTGILRALAQSLGSAFEVIEGFAEGLISRGHDPLTSTPPEPVERLFVAHLRDYCGVDLGFKQSGIRLHRAPSISLRWMDDGRRVVTDDVTGRVAHLGSQAVTLLDRFDRGRTAFEVCERIAAQVPTDQREKLRTDLQLTVEKLAALGFLLPGEQTPDLDGEEVPFTGLEEFEFHCRMLADTTRVEAYRRALDAVVRPGMHVVEIGTGTGVLAVLAARAGARVTAIEQFSLLNIARAVAQESGVESQIELVRGRSDRVQLEERGDLLISEIVGNRILNEGLLEMTLDARERLLKPDALLIPERIEILAELGHTERFVLLDQQLTRLCSRYDVDLQPLHQWFKKRKEAGRLIWETHQEDDDFSPMTDEVVVIDLDLRQIEHADFSRTTELVPVVDGPANAVVLAFTLQLQPGITLSTRGRRHDLHWSKPVFMLPSPVQLQRGRPVRLQISYEAHGEIQIAVG